MPAATTPDICDHTLGSLYCTLPHPSAHLPRLDPTHDELVAEIKDRVARHEQRDRTAR